jgi:hypothetical protein
MSHTHHRQGVTVKKKLLDRLSPSMIVAMISLVVAMGGTAVAASQVLIDSPDQLANGVVTIGKLASSSVNGTKILNGSVLQADQVHPVVRAQVNADGTLADAGDATVAKLPLDGPGHYRLTFDESDFNGVTDLDQCAITANPTQHGPFGGPMMVDVTSVSGFSVTVVTSWVTVVRQGVPENILRPVETDSGFDLIAAC